MCQEAVNNRNKCYQELIKCLGKYQLLQYRKVSNKTRTIIKNRKRLNINEFVDGLDPNSNKNFWKVIKLFRNSEVLN